jgi:hypothetical protein
MHALLQETVPCDSDIRVAFSRAARLALAGLLVAPALLGLASAAGHPLRAAVDAALWISALAGFGGAGWFAARRLRAGPRRQAALAGVFLAAGLLVTPAFRGIQGLTGRESMVAVAAATLPAFGLAFAVTGACAARVLGSPRLPLRGILACAAGGLLGGAFAMLPFCWAWLRLDVPGEPYLVMGLAVAGFLGCLIAPFSVVGLALDRARSAGGLARA